MVRRNGQVRRAEVLTVAAELFKERGYHATSMDDIGEAVGIAGPSVYRHFPSKDKILTTIFDQIWEHAVPALDGSSTAESAEAAMRILVEERVEMALGNSVAILLLERELRHVPDAYAEAAARHIDRFYSVWTTALRRLRPELSMPEATEMVHATLGLIGTGAQKSSSLSSAARRRILAEMALCALATPLPEDAHRPARPRVRDRK